MSETAGSLFLFYSNISSLCQLNSTKLVFVLCRPRLQTSACQVRITRGPLLCILLLVGGTVASLRDCCGWGQKSSETTGVALHYMMQQRMERWRYGPDFFFLNKDMPRSWKLSYQCQKSYLKSASLINYDFFSAAGYF